MTTAHLLHVCVSTRAEIAQGIALFRLVSSDGSALPACPPGAHIDVHLPGNLVRQYSISNAPTSTSGYEIAVLKEVNGRGGSVAIHNLVQPGQMIPISAPRNMFALEAGAAHHVLVAGGIGITPILSMAEHLYRAGESFELHYCVRSPERAAFHQHLHHAPYSDRVSFYFDSDATGKKLDIAEALSNRSSQDGTHLYICGPNGFMDSVSAAALRQGLEARQIHVEHFSAGSVDGSTNAPFEIQLQRSGRIVSVSKDQTALEALHAAGLQVPISCGQGVCGTCMVSVMKGVVDHRDAYLTQEERDAQDCFLPCCSRATSASLTVDL